MSEEEDLIALNDAILDAVIPMLEVIRAGREAVMTMRQEYRAVHPDAAPGECWEEVNGLADAITAVWPHILVITELTEPVVAGSPRESIRSAIGPPAWPGQSA